MSWKFVPLMALTLAVASRGDETKDRPAPSPDLFAEAKALSTREDWEEATAKFREFLRVHPDDSRANEAQFWIGFCLVKSGEFDEAVRELKPFDENLAKDTWADDALLQLGHAHRGNEDNDRAVSTWKRLLEVHPDSVWKTEAALQIIDVLFHDAKDYAACLTQCERVVKESDDASAVSEARYAGAYCLNTLDRFDDAERWMDRWFSPDDAIQAGWRRVLTAQRELRQGHPTQAFAAIDGIDADFPDLDQGDRLDLTLRTAAMLTREKQAGRARDLVTAALKQSDRNEDDIEALLEQLKDSTPEDEFPDALKRLATDSSLPLMIRLAIRAQRVEALREKDEPAEAEALLREALAKEDSEYTRFRTATLLAELLGDDLENRDEAIKVLDGVLPKLHRQDLAHQVREMLKDLREQPED